MPGRVITFYSFKGGTGRSMALANVASSIAQRNGGRKVLVVDWDLEAPGLHRYFCPYVKVSDPDRRGEEIDEHLGLIEFLTEARARALALPKDAERDELQNSVFKPLDLDSYLMPSDLPGLSLLTAGRFDPGYSTRINTFDWEGLYQWQPLFFGAMADYLSTRFDFVFIDSRTGHTDISGICTCLLPDTLVAVFTPNRQSLYGALAMIAQSVKYRMNSDDLRPLVTFPLASRIELSEKKLNDSWRFGNRAEGVNGYQPAFERLFKEVYTVDDCNLAKYFDEAQVQYVPFYAFGEEIAVRLGETAHFSLARSYEAFTDILLGSAVAWEFAGREDSSALLGEESLPLIPWDEKWFEGHKKNAISGLHAAAQSTFIEVRFSLSRLRLKLTRLKLRDAVSAAQVTVGARPLGMVGNERPVEDGIAAELSSEDYEYWALRESGEFFLLRAVRAHERETRHVWPVELIHEVAEALSFCSRLYVHLGVAAGAEVRIDIRHSGLASWILRVPSGHGGNANFPKTTMVNETRDEIATPLGRMNEELPELVKHFVAPLIEIFDFSTLHETDYQQMVSSFVRLKARRFTAPPAPQSSQPRS